MKAIFRSFGILLLVAIIFLGYRCRMQTSPAYPNMPPNTTLANIPVPNDTIFALVTLHWDGEDDDGYIVGYEYRYITHHVYVGDSLVQPWKKTEKTSLTIAFESSDDLNYQIFQVRSIDNKGDVDPTPAERRFYTYKTTFPITTLISPTNNQVFFAIDHTTDWWSGVQITFTAEDKDFQGEVVEYAWAVDNGPWHWTKDTTLFITPDNFIPLSGKHTIRVTSRDNTNLVDPVGDSAVVRLIVPIFDRRILIIDETIEKDFPFGVVATDEDVDNFYKELFDSPYEWDYTKRGFPPKDTLAHYQMIIWHADNCYSAATAHHKLPNHIREIMDYLNVGGDLIMSGWRILKSFAPLAPFPQAFAEGTFIHDYLHINIADETSSAPDFIGAKGIGNFTTIRVDSAKLANAFPYYGKLAQINIIPSRAGFTDVIYTYNNENNSQFVQYRGRPCGLRYYGTVFDAVVFGFPIFFIEKNDAKILAKEILQSLGY